MTMASVRVEDEAREDPRIKLLGQRLGTSRFDALARMIELWSQCTARQSYFLSPAIIDTLAERDGFHALICEPEIGLGEPSEKGIRIKGTRGRIEWLAKLRNNSKKGGEKTKAKWLAKEKPNTGPEEGPLITVPVLAPAPVPAPVKKRRRRNLAAEPSAPPPTSATWEAYREAYRHRYGVDPLRNASVNGILSRFVARVGADDSPPVAAFYLTHNDAFYVRAKHQVGLMLRDAEKLHAEWRSGEKSTQTEARQVDRRQANYNAFAPLIEEAERKEREAGHG